MEKYTERIRKIFESIRSISYSDYSDGNPPTKVVISWQDVGNGRHDWIYYDQEIDESHAYGPYRVGSRGRYAEKIKEVTGIDLANPSILVRSPEKSILVALVEKSTLSPPEKSILVNLLDADYLLDDTDL